MYIHIYLIRNSRIGHCKYYAKLNKRIDRECITNTQTNYTAGGLLVL